MTQEVAMYQAATRYTEQDLSALKDTVAKSCTDAQFKVFMLAARRLGLDPFARQIVPITQGGGMTPQITIDGFRLIAQRTGQYGGQVGPFWCGLDGVWHDVWLAKEPPAAAKVGVIRRDFAEPMWGVARFASYSKGGNWAGMPDVMIAKVAESLALRKAFPQELAGIYGEEEMAGAGPLVNTTTGEVVEPAPIRALSPQQPRGKASPAAQADVVYSTGASIQQLRIKLRAYGITTLAKADALSRELLGRDWEHVTEADAPTFARWIAEVERTRAEIAEVERTAREEADVEGVEMETPA